MLLWTLKGWLAVLVIVSLLVYPFCLWFSFHEAMQYVRQLAVILGWYWLLASAPTRWVADRIQQRIAVG